MIIYGSWAAAKRLDKAFEKYVVQWSNARRIQRRLNRLAREGLDGQFPWMNTDPGKPNVTVFWILWFALFNGLLIFMFMLGGGLPEGENQGKAPTLLIAMAALLALISVAIRFLVIPKTRGLEQLLPLMLVGMAFAEGVGIIGIFVVAKEFPETRLALFVTSVSAMLAYAPFYANAVLDKKRMR